MIKEVLKNTEISCDKTIEFLKQEFSWFQAWKASPLMVENIAISVYGQNMPLKACAWISTPEFNQIHITPFDKWNIQSIEKSLSESDFWFNPQNNWVSIILTIPALTEEKRKDLVKVIHKKAEDAKISIRQIRQNAKSKIEKMWKDKEISEDELRDWEEDLQKVINSKTSVVDELLKHKEEAVKKV